MALFNLIASTETAGVVSGPATTAAINTTGATIIVVTGSVIGSASPTLSDSAGNTWPTRQDTPTTWGAKTSVWVLRAPTTSATHTFTVSGTNIFGSISVLAFSGDVPTTGFLSSFVNSATGSDAATAFLSEAQGQITPPDNNALVIIGLTLGSNDTGLAVDSGFTIQERQPGASGVAYSGAVAYKIQTTAQAERPLFSWTTAQGANSSLFWIKSGHVPGAGPTITTQPSNASVTAPATATFTVSATASGGSLSYQWQVSTNSGSSWSNVSDGTGATSASYTTSATAVSTGNHRNGYQYRCAVTDSNGTVNSSAATLTVAAPALSVTLDTLVDESGNTRAAYLVDKIWAIRISDNTLVATWTSQTTNGSGVLPALSNAGLTAVPHEFVTYTATGPRSGAKVYTPS